MFDSTDIADLDVATEHLPAVVLWADGGIRHFRDAARGLEGLSPRRRYPLVKLKFSPREIAKPHIIDDLVEAMQIVTKERDPFYREFEGVPATRVLAAHATSTHNATGWEMLVVHPQPRRVRHFDPKSLFRTTGRPEVLAKTPYARLAELAEDLDDPVRAHQAFHETYGSDRVELCAAMSLEEILAVLAGPQRRLSRSSNTRLATKLLNSPWPDTDEQPRRELAAKLLMRIDDEMDLDSFEGLLETLL